MADASHQPAAGPSLFGGIWTLAKKDLKLLFRDRFALFWVFAFPLMYCMFLLQYTDNEYF